MYIHILSVQRCIFTYVYAHITTTQIKIQNISSSLARLAFHSRHKEKALESFLVLFFLESFE